LLLADEFHLAHGSSVLPPAEALLDALADPLAEEVTLMPSRARIDRPDALLGAADRHGRRHSALAALGYEVGGVVCFVRR
jgi:hypothetical protein